MEGSWAQTMAPMTLGGEEGESAQVMMREWGEVRAEV